MTLLRRYDDVSTEVGDHLSALSRVDAGKHCGFKEVTPEGSQPLGKLPTGPAVLQPGDAMLQLSLRAAPSRRGALAPPGGLTTAGGQAAATRPACPLDCTRSADSSR